MQVREKINFDDFENGIKNISSFKNYFNNTTAIILGANGIVGSNLLLALYYARVICDINIRIVAVSRSSPSERISILLGKKDIEFFHFDISQKFPNLNINGEFIMLHCASQASPKFYNIDPVGTILTNSVGTYNSLEFSINGDCKGFLFISAGEVYGKMDSEIVTESTFGPLDPLHLRSCYAEGKRCGEALCKAYNHQYGIETRVARLFHTYGPGLSFNDGRIFADITRDIIQKKQIILYSDGSAIRCFAYISDVVNALFRVLIFGKSGQAYNVANVDQVLSIKSLAERLSICFGLSDSPKYIKRDINSNYATSPYSALIPDVSKVKSLGWHPLINVEQGFARTIDWYHNQLIY